MSLLLRILFAIVALCIVPATEARMRTLVPPLAQLGGSWLGTSERHSEYFRVEFDSSGKGVLTIEFVAGGPTDAYEILSTSLSGYSISFLLRPFAEAEPIFARGTANKLGLWLDVGDINGKWTRKVFLEPESDVLGRIDAVTRRAQEVKSRAHSGLER
jgi:hypothetical protein